MNRRDFLAGAATGVAVGAAGAYGATRLDLPVGSPAIPQSVSTSQQSAPTVLKRVRELTLVTMWPKDFPGLGTGAQRAADRISAMTDGSLTIKLHASGELVPPLEAFDAVAKGTVDMYHGSESYWADKSRAFNFFATVPGGLLAPEIGAWIRHGGGQALWDEVAGGFGVKPLLCGNTGMQMGGWFNREIRAAADFKDLKLQIPGLGAEVASRLGAQPSTLPAAQIFPALQSGAIDGAEWFGPWNDFAFGFHKVAKYYYWPGFHEPGPAVSLGINSAVWASLTNTERAIVEAAASAENDCMYTEFMARNGEALEKLIREQGVQLRKFPDDALQAIGQAVATVMTEVADSDPLTKKVHQSYVAFRRTVSEWTTLSEQGYANARSRFYS